MALPYQDSSRSVPDRANDVVSRMTFEEKAAQMHALWLILSEDGQHRPRQDDFTGGSDPAVVKQALGHGLGQISRPLGSHGVDPRTGVRALNRLQKFLREETRLGIPALSHEECLVGLMARGATLFPSALAYSATWNPDLVERAAQAIGREARSVGCHQGLAPVLDVSRDVRWGRTEETLGEDPYLVGVLGTRFVRGLQGDKRDLLATLKHYAGHSWSEGARNHGPVHLGWRELNDVFLLPFEMCVKQARAGIGDAGVPRPRQRVLPRLAPPAHRGAARGVGLRRADRGRLHRHQPALPAPQPRPGPRGGGGARVQRRPGHRAAGGRLRVAPRRGAPARPDLDRDDRRGGATHPDGEDPPRAAGAALRGRGGDRAPGTRHRRGGARGGAPGGGGARERRGAAARPRARQSASP